MADQHPDLLLIQLYCIIPDCVTSLSRNIIVSSLEGVEFKELKSTLCCIADLLENIVN